MIRGLERSSGGFTILETIIVLTVMSVLLASTLLLFQQRVSRTQFTKSLNELTTQMSDISNQVISGHYPKTNQYACVNGIIDTLNSDEQGQNENCLFLGQAIKFGYSGCKNSGNECDKLRVYTVFGRRLNGASIAKSLIEADAKISPDFGVQDYTNGYGLSVEKVFVGADEYGGVAYLQSFGSDIGGGQLNGAPQITIAPIGPGTTVNSAYSVFESTSLPAGFASTIGSLNPQIGITLCVKSGTTDQYALVILGANGNAMSVEKQIVNESEWNGKCLIP